MDEKKVQNSADLLITANRLGESWKVTAANGTQHRRLAHGIYLISAFDSTCYARDGQWTTLDTDRAHRIEAGDSVIWESEPENDTLTVYASAGGEIRVTPRRA